jgi:cobalt-zinc-cadmium efflux system protein
VATSRHHSHNHNHHHGRKGEGRALYWALVLTAVFAAIEAAGGWWAGSLALLSDAGHMFSDSAALALAAFAAWIARRPVSLRHSYGFVRAEIVAALVNGIAMLLVIVGIVVEAIERLRSPSPVAGGAVMLIAFVGLLINVAVAFALSRGEHDINIRGALLHVLGDVLGSFAALLAGAVIYFTGWTPVDPILSLIVACLILFSALNLLREALHVLMEGVPLTLQLDVVGREMAKVKGVQSVHDLHIWTLASGMVALSAHLVLEDMKAWPQALEATRKMLHDHFDIAHITLQPEPPEWIEQPYRATIPIFPK